MNIDVDPDALRTAAQHVRGTSEGLVGVRDGFRQLSTPAEPPMTRAIRILRDACGAVTALIAEDAALTATKLEAAADIYVELDAHLDSEFGDRQRQRAGRATRGSG